MNSHPLRIKRKDMSLHFIFSAIFLKGLCSVIIQTLLIRELLVVFNGNELTFGLQLCAWMLGGALGSAALAFTLKIKKSRIRAFCSLQITSAILAPLALLLIRSSRDFFHVGTGQTLGLAQTIALSVLSLSFCAWCDGALFSLGLNLVRFHSKKEEPPLARTYLLESLGVIAGGIAFTFILLQCFNSLQIILILSSLTLISSSLLLYKDRRIILRILPWLLFLGSLILLANAARIESISIKRQWRGKNILYAANSPFGNIVLSRSKDQYTIYYDGLPALTVPYSDLYFTEDFSHLPLLSFPEAKKILIIGHAAGGLLQEIFKHQVEKVSAIEIDPVFFKLLKRLPIDLLDQEFKDPRLRLLSGDARTFIKEASNSFDLIFVNIEMPTSLSLNRYFTEEFFSLTAERLSPSGRIALKIPGSLSYLSDEIKNINAAMLKTLAGSFAFMQIIPGDGFNIVLASEAPFSLAPEDLIARLKQINLKTNLFHPEYIRLRLDPQYNRWLMSSLKEPLGQAGVNQDLKPSILYDSLSLHYAPFNKSIPSLFNLLKKFKTRHLLSVLSLFMAIWILFLKKRRSLLAALSGTIASTGFYSMSVQIIVLLAFQSRLGYLFEWLAILTTAFMAGVSIGAFIVNQRKPFTRSIRPVYRTEAFMTILILALSALVLNFSKINSIPALLLPWPFCLISLASGLYLGLQMPLVFAALNEEKKSPQIWISAGWFYSLDLTGGCLAALVVPILLVPACGAVPTLFLLSLAKLANSLALKIIFSKNSQSSSDSLS